MKADNTNWGGARRNAGRKKGVGVSYDIQKYCQEFIEKILDDDKIRAKALRQLVDRDLKWDNDKNKHCVYVIEVDGLYKIGFSSDFNKRVSSYNTHNPTNKIICVAFSLNAFDLESILHKKWIDCNVRGEWFNLTDLELKELLNEINTFCYGRS